MAKRKAVMPFDEAVNKRLMRGPRHPTRRQREIMRRFKAGEEVAEIAGSMSGGDGITFLDHKDEVEAAIRACLVWGRRGDV